MATRQKFKLFAIHCGTSRSPTRSPRTSPVHLRRRRTTLSMLLGRRGGARRRREPTLQRECLLEKKGEDLVRRHSLKDLFVSSPPGEEDITNHETHNSATNDDPGAIGSGHVPGSPRPDGSGFRYKSLLSKKAWRPVLLTIDE